VHGGSCALGSSIGSAMGMGGAGSVDSVGGDGGSADAGAASTSAGGSCDVGFTWPDCGREPCGINGAGACGAVAVTGEQGADAPHPSTSSASSTHICVSASAGWYLFSGVRHRRCESRSRAR